MRAAIGSIGALFCLLLHWSIYAQPAAPPVKDLGDGRFQIGLVTLHRQSNSVTFPAAVNMSNGLVEYMLVTTSGKVHESVFKTEAEPFHIHTAVLLLGAQLSTNTDSAVFFDAKREIPGPKLKIEVILPSQQGKVRPLHEFLEYIQTKTPVTADTIPHWVYNGSRVSDGVFLAQREGSIVSLIADPAALINNPREDRENDELWSANSTTVPPIDTAVMVKLTILAEKQ